MKYIELVNWREYQHYKDRNPPWIKLYARLLDSYQWVDLSDASKLLHMVLFLVASRTNNKIPMSSDHVKRISGIKGDVCFDELMSVLDDNGSPKYVRFYTNDSDMLAGCKQDAIPEQSRGEKRREEGDGSAEASPVQSNLIPEKYITTFPSKDGEWGLTYPKFNELRDTYRARYPKDSAFKQEIKEARQWLRDNPQKQKTARGMPRFLSGWLSRQKASQPDNGQPSREGPPVSLTDIINMAK
jgi:hypothetical protein